MARFKGANARENRLDFGGSAAGEAVEPFGGTGSVLLALTPFEREIYNDADERLVDFFRAIADDESRAKLRRWGETFPQSRAIFDETKRDWIRSPELAKRAFALFYVQSFSFGGKPFDAFGFARKIYANHDRDMSALYRRRVATLDANGARVKSRLGEYWERFLGELRALGRAVSTFKLDGFRFGGASKRVRLHVAGVLDAASPFTPPEAPPKVATKTIRDCLRFDLPTKSLAHLRGKATLARLDAARDAGFSDAIFPNHGSLHEARPLDGAFPTSTTRPPMFVGDNLKNYRYLTASEAGAALGFPDDFIYVGTESDAYRGVGGSVSVDATEAILTKLFGEVF